MRKDVANKLAEYEGEDQQYYNDNVVYDPQNNMNNDQYMQQQ